MGTLSDNLFGNSDGETVKLTRDSERRAVDYKFRPSIDDVEVRKNVLKLVDSVDEWDGMELAEKNPRLLTVVLTILTEVERLRLAGEDTRQYAKSRGESGEAVEAMVQKTSVAEVAYIIDAYATGKFIIE